MEIGVLLKEAREEKGFTLDNIQEKTKIQKRYLVAIEQDDFSALPGKFYARAFIKEYAEAVDLDPDVVLANFKEEKDIPEEEPVKYTRLDRSEKMNESKKSSILSFLPTLIVIFLIVAIVGVAIMYYQKSLSDSEGDTVQSDETDEVVRKEKDSDEADEIEGNDETEKDENADEEEKENSTENGEFEVIETGTGSSPESTLEFTGAEEKALVEVETTSDTYLDVKDDKDEVYFSGTFTSDSTEKEFDLSGQERIYFNIGNASDISIKINGTELEFPIDPTKSVHQKLWIDLK
ncbi:MAG TPA: RodZ domain-containing protein [Pseudogracilibacillus sp.]|nr:RodZ domain-containing protein [Pseudogracilibacillus sp.]